MKLRNKKGYLNVLPEGRPPKKKSMWFVTILYLVLLAGVIGYVLKFGLERLLFVSSRGQVEVARHTVDCKEACQIRSFLVDVGDKVRQGDPLVLVHRQQEVSISDNEQFKIQKQIGLKQEQVATLKTKIEELTRHKQEQVETGQESAINLSREILQVNYQIAARRSDLQELRNQLSRTIETWQDEHISLSLLLELRTRTDREVMSLQDKVASLQDKVISMEENLAALYVFRDQLYDQSIGKLKEERQSLQVELDYLKKYLENLEARKMEGLFDDQLITAHSGEVFMLFKQPGDLCSRGEALVSIQQTDPVVKINGFFPLHALTYIKPGKNVTVFFPDKHKSKGIIERVYSTALPEPKLIKKEYMPIEVKIKVEILPLKPQERALWKEYEQMDVLVRIRK